MAGDIVASPLTSRNSVLNGSQFILLVAGHETSSHAISFALAAIAVHPEIQRKALEEIRAVVPEGELPVSLLFYYLLLSWFDLWHLAVVLGCYPVQLHPRHFLRSPAKVPVGASYAQGERCRYHPTYQKQKWGNRSGPVSKRHAG